MHHRKAGWCKGADRERTVYGSVSLRKLNHTETMEANTINMYLNANAKYFDASAVPMLRTKMEKLDETAMATLQAVDLKDPTMMLVISLLLGAFGVDRFMIGDIGMGVLKLCTGGLCGIMWLIDIFTMSKKVKEKNLAAVSMVL